MEEMSKYGGLTIDRLREELRTRGAKLSGRKKELVERLHAYDRNFNFGKTIQKDLCPEFKMETPEGHTYKDLHVGMAIPEVTMDNIRTYLEALNKTLGKESINLVNERFLRYIKISLSSGICYVKSQCWAEMKKSVKYNLDIAIDSNGLVEQCQCDCGSGMGPEAHCKHVNALLYALFKFNVSSELVTEESCTQRLQTFHHVKKHKGSPIKAIHLRLTDRNRKRKKTGKLCKPLNYDPRSTRLRKKAGYADYFRNRCLNYSKGSGTIPFCQLFAPANTYAVANDHDYLAETPQDSFLRKMEISVISDNSIKDIEKRTRDQASCKEWIEMRGLRLNSSNFGRICKLTELTDKAKYATDLTVYKTINCAAVKHGRKFEKLALKTFKEKSGLKVEKCGTFICKQYPFIASSPDGLVGDMATVEVKCPFASKDKMISHLTVPYLVADGNGCYKLNRSHDYFYQVQAQMLCTNRQCCYFCVFTLKDFVVITVQIDTEFINQMIIKLTSFFEDYYRKAVLEKFFFRNYRKFNFS